MLSDIVEGEEERAIHLALATSEPDETVASEVERAAAQARGRGAFAASATLFEHAARLTPANAAETRGRRFLAAAELLLEGGGDPRRAGELLNRLIESLPAGPQRAEALVLLGWVEDDLRTCERLAQQALSEAKGADRIEARTHHSRAVVKSIRMQYSETVWQAALAAQLAERSGETELQALALAELGHARTFLGHGVTRESRRTAELESSLRCTGQNSGRALLGRVLMFDGQFDEARTVLEDELERATSSGHHRARTEHPPGFGSNSTFASGTG